ncbi:MAG: HlyD family efflux transporter periplasmic adaptor subunit, partial [Acidobacteria bacterium]|nr:HlyD family efflux transporter periplasmic adaptor subunit [Acidobacteriota bacterium]
MLLVGLGLIGYGVWAWRERVTRSQAPPEVPANASAAQPARRVVAASGRVEPVSEEVVVSAEIPGRVIALLVEEGDSVRSGAVLARLDDAEHQARLDLALALKLQREAELQRLRNGARSQERREAQALKEEAQAVVDNMRLESDRRRALFNTGDIAREEVERAERQLMVARARLAAAAERYSLVEAAARVEDIARAEAELAAAEASLTAARVQKEKTVIRAPLDGVVLRRHLRVGEYASSGPTGSPAPVFTLADISQLRVRAEIDELDVAPIAVGQPAWITIDAYGGQRFNGRVARIAEVVGRKTLRSDNPAERNDTKILETLVNLDPIVDSSSRVGLPKIGLRVNVFVDTLSYQDRNVP